MSGRVKVQVQVTKDIAFVQETEPNLNLRWPCLKSRNDIERMRRAGRCRKVWRKCGRRRAGLTPRACGCPATNASVGAISGSRNYPTYKEARLSRFTCVDVNEQVVHGLPGGATLRAGRRQARVALPSKGLRRHRLNRWLRPGRALSRAARRDAAEDGARSRAHQPGKRWSESQAHAVQRRAKRVNSSASS